MNTIKSSEDISYIFSEGRRIGTPGFSLIVLRNNQLHDLNGRVAFIAGKKLGNAVWRNKAKRKMRALCYQLGGEVPSYDVIFLARKKINEIPFSDLIAYAKDALKKIDH